MTALLLGLWARAQGWALALGAALALLAGAYLRGRRSGAQAAQQQEDKATIQATEKAHEAAREYDAGGGALGSLQRGTFGRSMRGRPGADP